MTEKRQEAEPSESEAETIDQNYKFKKSSLMRLVNWYYLGLAYVPYVFYAILILIPLQVLHVVFVHKFGGVFARIYIY